MLYPTFRALSHLRDAPGCGMLHCSRASGAPVVRAMLGSVRPGRALLGGNGARHSVQCNRVLHGSLGGGGCLLVRRPYLTNAP